jgi:phospholipid/cholesterol/gamma-HCH transport system substrate-binding protein
VIFDDARGLIGGQLVKIAGARAGTIENVVVTPDFKARIEATVDSRFVPLHQDATCTIRPEGLIAENYVDCDPGTANSPPLQSSGKNPPTVPVKNTTEPVSLLDLFNIFNMPTRERFAVIVNELGIGTSARGQDFNDVLRRANPALALTRQVISILARQKAQLATILDATNTIAAQAAAGAGNLQRFLDRAAGLSTLTAAHRDSLSLTINRLPGLLAAARPSLQELDRVAVQGTPLLQQIQASVPGLNRVANDLGPFVAVAKPGLQKLGTALETAIPAIKHTTPVVQTLRNYTHASLANTLLFAKLSKNLQQHGFVENFLTITYEIGASLARFDPTSHLLSVLLVGAHNGTCSVYSTNPISGCSAHYGQQPAYTPSSELARRAAERPATATSPPAAPAAVLNPRAPQPPAAQTTQGQAANQQGPSSPASGALSQVQQTLQNLVNYLLK